uniref:uncharacterized protein LOC118151348 n=1 Tax=Callithrix jacchus TaxID=9483 RepID=UPI00159E90A1|nr:uncharacterized protein LOC118151348 [Callithrix jacchus]
MAFKRILYRLYLKIVLGQRREVAQDQSVLKDWTPSRHAGAPRFTDWPPYKTGGPYPGGPGRRRSPKTRSPAAWGGAQRGHELHPATNERRTGDAEACEGARASSTARQAKWRVGRGPEPPAARGTSLTNSLQRLQTGSTNREPKRVAGRGGARTNELRRPRPRRPGRKEGTSGHNTALGTAFPSPPTCRGVLHMRTGFFCPPIIFRQQI